MRSEAPTLCVLGAMVAVVLSTAAIEVATMRLRDPLDAQWGELKEAQARAVEARNAQKRSLLAREAVSMASAATASASATGRDRAIAMQPALCLAEYISRRQPANPHPGRFAAAIVDAAQTEDAVSASVLAAVAWKESSYGAPRYMLGDGGQACGPWQQWPRWLFAPEDRTPERVAWMCDWLIHDHETAAVVAARQLASRPHLCHYNQGNECDAGETYSAEVMAEAALIEAACPELVTVR